MQVVRRRVDPSTAGLVLVIALVLRMAAVVGRQAFVFQDSVEYETLDFSGRSRRPWVTPLLYTIADGPAMRIVAQALIGAACWSYLAVAVADVVADRRVRFTALIAILGVSLTTAVTNWDTAMLSESVALSLSALVLGALLRFAQRRTITAAGVVLAAWVPWMFSRQSHLALGWLTIGAVVLMVVVDLVRSRRLDRVVGALLAGLVALTAAASISYSRNTEIIDFNLASVIAGRVLTDPHRTSWFAARGMPVPRVTVHDEHVVPEELLADPRFRSWIHARGARTYARFLVTHPWDTITDPLEDLVSDRASFDDTARGRPSDQVLLAGADSYGVGRQVIPEPIENLLFSPGNAGTAVFALVVVLVLTVRRWRMLGADTRWIVPLVAILLQWPALTIVWHASVKELGRLATPSAVVLRVALVAQIALLVDAWLADRRAGST